MLPARRRASSNDGTEHHQQVATTEQFQISAEAAELYESAFVPALFAQWPPRLCRAAGVQHGSHVLDVACGTGIVARTAAGIAGRRGVVGVDLNEAMLAVARRIEPHLEWRRGDVAALPFDDGTFDVVLCQMALMFFPDRRGRSGRWPGSSHLVGPWASSCRPRWPQAGYGPFVEMAVRHAGPDAAALLGTYFSCGGLDGSSVSWRRPVSTSRWPAPSRAPTGHRPWTPS